MYTRPSCTDGDASSAALVGNVQATSPVFRRTAYRRLSLLVTYTSPSSNAGVPCTAPLVRSDHSEAPSLTATACTLPSLQPKTRRPSASSGHDCTAEPASYVQRTSPEPCL